ncbi:hypothetical protein OAG48_00015 [bacterium]|nr:hypothetical protein [bacterium]
MVALAVLVELGILFFCYQYEVTQAPVGVYTLWGISALGAILLLIELLKLPTAFWLAGRKGLARKSILSVVLLTPLCLITWEVTKDMATNEVVLSLEPAVQLEKEAAGLEARNGDIRDSLARREHDAKASETALEKIRRESAAHLSDLQDRRKVEISNFMSADESISRDFGNTPAEKSERVNLENRRAEIQSRFDADYGILQVALKDEENRIHAARKSDEASFARKIEAWKLECSQKTKLFENDRASAGERLRLAMKTFEREQIEYREQLERLDLKRSKVIEKRDSEIRKHEENNRPFYDLASKIKRVKEEARAEIDRIESQIASLVRPVKPDQLDAPSDVVLPTRPVMPEITGRNESQVALQITFLRNKRDDELAKISVELARLDGAASVRLQDRMVEFEIEQAKIRESHLSRLEAIDDEIRQSRAKSSVRIEELQLAAVSAASLQSSKQKFTNEIELNDGKARSLRTEASELRRRTQVYRIAGFLKWFMPNETSDEKLANMVQATVIPGVALLAAFLPTFLLEIGIATWNGPSSRRSLWKKIGVARRAVRRKESRHARGISKLKADHSSELAKVSDEKDALERSFESRARNIELTAREMEEIQAEEIRNAIEEKDRSVRRLDDVSGRYEAQAARSAAEHKTSLEELRSAHAVDISRMERVSLNVEQDAASKVLAAEAEVQHARGERDAALENVANQLMKKGVEMNARVSRIRRKADRRADATHRGRIEQLEAEIRGLKDSMVDLRAQGREDRRNNSELSITNRELNEINRKKNEDLLALGESLISMHGQANADPNSDDSTAGFRL